MTNSDALEAAHIDHSELVKRLKTMLALYESNADIRVLGVSILKQAIAALADEGHTK